MKDYLVVKQTIRLLMCVRNIAIIDELSYREGEFFHISPWVEWKKSDCRRILLDSISTLMELMENNDNIRINIKKDLSIRERFIRRYETKKN